MVPVFIDEMFVSMSSCKNGNEQTCVGSSSVKKHGFDGIMSNVEAFRSSDMVSQVQVRGLLLKSPGGSARNPVEPKEVCTRLDWSRLEEETAPLDMERNGFVIVLPESPSTFTANVATQIQKTLENDGHEAEILKVSQIKFSSSDERMMISLLEADGSIFSNPSDDDFHALQQIVAHFSKVLWVSQDNSEGSTIPGFARSLRSENPSSSFRTVQVSEESLGDDSLGHVIARCARISKSHEMEFREQNGDLFVPRLDIAGDLNLQLDSLRKDEIILEEGKTVSIQLSR